MPRARALLIATCSLALAACTTSTPTTPPAASGAPGFSAPPASADEGSATASAASPSSTPIAASPPAIGLELVVDGLVDPIGVTGTPEGWLLVNERGGRVVAVDPSDGRTVVTVDLTDRVLGRGEQGLLGLALHPGWPDVPRAFIHYSARSNQDGVLSELSATPGSADAAPLLDAASERELLRVPDPYPNHNGGQLAFGPDGFLYMGLGDGGAGGDPLGNGQDSSTLLGSILRLDVSTPGVLAIPPDNPFADGQGGAPEVFLYGLRNPWRFSFDAPTGLLWIADVGQSAFEEVNRIDPVAQSGANLGWSVMEAGSCFEAPDCDSEGLTLPLVQYGRALGGSITGGFVYHGRAVPDLEGWYVFGDYLGRQMFAVAADAQPGAAGAPIEPIPLFHTGFGISAFGLDSTGELYVADLGGRAIYRVVAP